MAAGWASTLATLQIAAVQGLILLLCFELLRSLPALQPVYQARHQRRASRTTRSPPSARPLRWLVAHLLDDHIRTHELVRMIGLDAFVCLRFCRMCTLFALFSGIPAVVLLPLYSNADLKNSDPDGFNSLTIAKVPPGSPVLWASLLMFVLFVFFVMWRLWEEWVLFLPLRRDFLARGDADTPTVFRYAIMVEDIPPKYQSPKGLAAFFSQLFPNQVRTAMVCLNTARMEDLLHKQEDAVNNYERAVLSQLALDRKNTQAHPPKPKENYTIKIDKQLFCFGGERVVALRYLAGKIERLTVEINAEHKLLVDGLSTLDSDWVQRVATTKSTVATGTDEEASTDLEAHSNLPLPLRTTSTSSSIVSALPLPTINVPLPLQNQHAYHRNRNRKRNKRKAPETASPVASSTGFVVFSSLAAKQCALQVTLSGKPGVISTCAAPEPGDMQWDNVTTPATAVRSKKTVANGLWLLGIFFWAVPVGFVQAIANLDSICSALGIWNVDKKAEWYRYLSGYLPVLALLLLMILLPTAIEFTAKSVIRLKSLSAIDAYVFSWHFGFQVANLWFSLLGQSLFSQLELLIDHPTAAFRVIAAAIPDVAQFFINLVITQTLAGLMLELCLVGPVLLYVFSKLANRDPTPQEKQKMTEPPFFRWGWIYPPMILNMFVCFTYCALVPVVPLFTACYFLLAYVVYRHQAVHVYCQKNEGGGELWIQLFRMIMGCLYMAELIFLAYMSLKQAVSQVPFALLLIVLTRLFHNRVKFEFERPSATLSLEIARTLDDQDPARAAAAGSSHLAPFASDAAYNTYREWLNDQAYVQPCLRDCTWVMSPQIKVSTPRPQT